MRVWITGGSGLLGSALQKVLQKKGIPFAASDRKKADISSAEALERFWKKEGPFTHLVNAAAYTKVDQAEVDLEVAYQINASALTLLGQFAAKKQLRLLHVSTDYVFSGRGEYPYQEGDLKAPETVYGKTKSLGEDLLISELPDACIVRTSWIFGPDGRNFVSTMLELREKQKEIKVVSDQKGRPTYSYDLAEAIVVLLGESGIYHVANSGQTSWYLFAQEILAGKCNLVPVETGAFLAKASRPLYSVLDTGKFDRQFGPLRPWQDALKEFLTHA